MSTLSHSTHRLSHLLHRLESGGALLPDSPENVTEVVGILKSYGVVLGEYWQNLIYISEHQFLVLFPFFKYFNGNVSPGKLVRHWFHDRINFEFSEYCMKAMFWHGGGGLDAYLDTIEFETLAKRAIQAKIKHNPFIQGVNAIFSSFLLEQVRQMAYYSALGQFWRVMSPMFLNLSDRYDQGEIKTIPDVVQHILDGLVAAATLPITYEVHIGDQPYDIIPRSTGLTFLADTAVPYVEAVFLRSFPFMGTTSYNAQARQIPIEQERFNYGALYADPLPIGGSGIPPTLLMQDMRHYLPDYMDTVYGDNPRGNTDLRVRLCVSFQKSMFCVTTAAIKGLMPYPPDTCEPSQQKANRRYLEGWLDRLQESRLMDIQD